MAWHNRATLSIVGLYNWDDTIFDDMVLPTGIDKTEIIEDILFQCAELEILYPDWGVMKKAIETWSKEEIFKWDKIQKLAELEYNPIENYDRMETETVQDSKEKTHNDVETGTAKSENITSSNADNNNTTTNAVTGFNTTTPVTDTQTTVTGAETGNGISNGTSRMSNAKNGNEKETGNIIRNNRTHGNIGVTAPYQMILGDLSVYDSINLYKIIPVDFKMRFCIGVY